jgi:hypothetical protein
LLSRTFNFSLGKEFDVDISGTGMAAKVNKIFSTSQILTF